MAKLEPMYFLKQVLFKYEDDESQSAHLHRKAATKQIQQHLMLFLYDVDCKSNMLELSEWDDKIKEGVAMFNTLHGLDLCIQENFLNYLTHVERNANE